MRSAPAIPIRTWSPAAAQDALAQLVKDNPQGRLITPEEVAASVLNLCRPESRGITGQSLLINGGEF